MHNSSNLEMNGVSNPESEMTVKLTGRLEESTCQESIEPRNFALFRALQVSEDKNRKAYSNLEINKLSSPKTIIIVIITQAISSKQIWTEKFLWDEKSGNIKKIRNTDQII